MQKLINEQITLRKLEVFSAFMKTENIARAGETLNMSAVSVHRSLHSLEEGIGCPLFMHKGRNLIALPTAKELYADIDRILNQLKSTIDATRRLGNVGNDHLRLGTLYSLTIKTVPQLIAGTKLRRPNIEFELHMDSNEELMKRLSENQLDAILIDTKKSVIDKTRYETLSLFTDELFLAALKTPSEAITGTGRVDLKKLAQEQFISLSDGFATFQDARSAFEIAGFEPRIVAKAKDIFSVLSMVQSGLGMALLPGRVFSVYERRVGFYPLDGRYQQYQNIGIVFDRSREHEPNLLALVAEGRMFARRMAALKVGQSPVLNER